MNTVQLYIIARPALDLANIAGFLGDERLTWRRSNRASDAEEIVEFAGRTCYLSFGRRQSRKSNYDYVAHLVSQGHESVLEHVAWTFVLTGVSRAFTHQLVRHRVGFSFSQLSQQYHEEVDATFVEPSIISADPELAELWASAVTRSVDTYRKILDTLAERGAAVTSEEFERNRQIRSAARSVLPEGTATKIVATANARALRHFLSIRGAIVGDEEMRRVCSLLLESMQLEAPALFADFTLDKLEDGSPIVLRRSITRGRELPPPAGP